MVPAHVTGAPGGRLPFIVGPTATGKTAMALALAERLPVEVVSCDSLQVYRHLDIGTSKPTADERARLPHHVVDLAPPDQPFDAGRYVEEADRAVADIRARGKVPLVVGGTGLYVRTLLHGLADAGHVPPEVKQELRRRLETEGLPALYARLQEVDPPLAERLPPGDTQRILRALEVWEATQQRLSDLQQAHRFRQRRYEPLVLVLHLPRPELYERIDRRVEDMLAQGLEDEVRRVLAMGYSPTAKALLAPGYREVVQHLAGELSAQEMTERIQRAHRRYAKRQLTWFQAVEGAVWLPAGDVAGAERRLREFLGHWPRASGGTQST